MLLTTLAVIFSLCSLCSQRFFCGGRLIFGPEVASLLVSTALIAVPAIAFCIKVYFIIRHHIKEGKPAISWYPVLVIGSLLTLLVSACDHQQDLLVFTSTLYSIHLPLCILSCLERGCYFTWQCSYIHSPNKKKEMNMWRARVLGTLDLHS